MIIINGKKYCDSFSGSLSIVDGKVTMNGKEVVDIEEFSEKEINIAIEGDVNKLEVANCYSINVSKNINSVSTRNGSVKCQGDIMGDVETRNGSVTAGGRIEGSVTTRNSSIRGCNS